MRTLLDAMPYFFKEYVDTLSFKHKDVEVIKEYCTVSDFANFKRWPGPQKNVFNWVVLANGKAVGWNESPSHGNSFPIITYKEQL